MKTGLGKKLLKTLTYRLTASALAQLLSWVFFRRVEVNVVILAIDSVQMGYYFLFESFWTIDKRQIEATRSRINSAYTQMLRCKTLLRQQGYPDRVIREIWKWYDSL